MSKYIFYVRTHLRCKPLNMTPSLIMCSSLESDKSDWKIPEASCQSQHMWNRRICQSETDGDWQVL